MLERLGTPVASSSASEIRISSRALARAPPNLPQTRLSRNVKAMDVQLTPDQLAFIHDAMQNGRLHSEEDAVKEALVLWEERERTRARILAAVDESEASLAGGAGRAITQQSMIDLANDVKRQGRARLAAGQSSGL